MNYLISRDEDFNEIKIGTVLNQFQTKELPDFNHRYNYYIGKQAILRKRPTDVGKACNKIVCNFCSTITDQYNGYIAGLPISYEGDNIEGIQDVLRYNDVKTEDTEFLHNALIFGRAFELCYIDEEAQQRFKVLDTRQCVPVYEDNLNGDLLYVIRFWKEDHIGVMMADEHYLVEVYGPNSIKRYRSNPGFSSFQLLEEVPHFYGQCPCSVFSLNDDEVSIFEQIFSLQDAYNELLSEEVDTFNSFSDAYLLMKGVTADGEDLANAKRSRCFMIDSDADISYLTKNVSDTQIEDMLTNIKNNIHKIANCPDLNDQQFNASTGIALRLKLVGLESKASEIESRMRKALQRRIELISAIESLTDTDAIWRDVKITFTRNLPTDNSETINLVNALRGLVSDETLLGLLPFIDDVNAEKARIAKQKEDNMAMYGFGANMTYESDETEEEE